MKNKPVDERDMIALGVGVCFGVMAVVVLIGFNGMFPISRHDLGDPDAPRLPQNVTVYELQEGTTTEWTSRVFPAADDRCVSDFDLQFINEEARKFATKCSSFIR